MLKVLWVGLEAHRHENSHGPNHGHHDHVREGAPFCKKGQSQKLYLYFERYSLMWFPT